MHRLQHKLAISSLGGGGACLEKSKRGVWSSFVIRNSKRRQTHRERMLKHRRPRDGSGNYGKRDGPLKHTCTRNKRRLILVALRFDNIACEGIQAPRKPHNSHSLEICGAARLASISAGTKQPTAFKFVDPVTRAHDLRAFRSCLVT
jgi:hypothetical protein